MKKILFFSIIFFCAWLSEARAPLESYKRYMIVLVHGTGSDRMIPHDYKADEKHEETDHRRKSAIWDRSQDDMGQGNWQGNIGGSLQARGFLGHVVWYDFYEPWKSPIRDENRSGFKESLSRYLGDRSVTGNKMATECRDVYEVEDHTFDYMMEAENYCTRIKNDDPSEEAPAFLLDEKCYNSIVVKDQCFGRTAQSYWLHEFFPNDLDSKEKVEYHNFKGSYLDLAKKDWELWYKLRNSTTTVDESEKPKKYILIAHSMGGLTTRDYITSDFYKGDVDKLITLDSPHEGSAIANYVQYWHEAIHWDENAGYLAQWLPPLILAAYMFTPAEIVASSLPTWLVQSSLLLATYSTKHTVASLVMDLGLSGYSDDGVKYGIDVMALDDGNAYGLYSSDTKDFLKKFNNRNKLVDQYENDYKIPYFRVVSTSGVPTPGGDGFHKAYKWPGVDLLAGFEEIALHSYESESGSSVEPAAVILKNFLGLLGQSMWNDWGSGFVPHWSGQGNHVALFNNGKSDVKRWNIAFNYPSLGDYGVELVALMTAFATGDYLIRKLPWDNFVTQALRFAGFVTTSYLSFKALTGNDLFGYVGFHGGMARRVDNDKASDAPSGVGSDKKMIDELLWEKPSVSVVYNPVNAWDISKGGYVGLGTKKELFEYNQSKDYHTFDVKWKGESSAHEFNINLTTISADDKSELKRAGTIYIAGKYAGSKLKSITLKKKKEKESDPEETKKIKVSECTDVLTGNNAGNEWFVSADNEGLLKCETGWDNSVSATYTMQVEVAHDGNEGGFLIDFGREPGRAFVAEELLTAKDSDWDKYITLKNRRPQKKKKVKNPTNDDLDRTVADMVDYHRSPLLVVNKLPRVLELEVDDLQPDRMNKLSIDFNFGTASITYTPKKDPNKYSEIPLKEPGKKFMDHPAGFIDPSVEEFKVVVALGGKKEELTMSNPIDAWGKIVIDLDALEEKIIEKKKKENNNFNEDVTIQPFLEGRNHLRIYSENRWQMSRVQDMNIFIPGPPPTVTPIYPMADDAFCSDENVGTEFKFETDLIYGQSSELTEDDLNVSYSKNGNITKIKGFDIKRVSGSKTKYTVTKKEKMIWPKGEFAIIIEVRPKINGSLANPITYQFAVKSDCVKPTVAFDDGQEVYNPSLAKFIVFDQDAKDGEHLSVEDLLVELLPAKASETDENSCDDSDDEAKWHLLSADNFAAPGAKVRDLTWLDDKGNAKYPDGKYRLAVFAHDNTINGNESDKLKKDFWKTYDKNGLPKMDENDFPKSRNPCNNVKAMTQWAKAEKNIVLDFTPPEIDAPSFSVAADKDGKIVYAGDALKKDLSVSVLATDALADDDYPLKGALTLTPSDNLGNFDSKDAINRFELLATKKAGAFDLKSTILSAVDPTVSSMVNVMRPIPDGVYALELTVVDQAGNSTSEWTIKDGAGNSTKRNYSLLVIDGTAPVIKNVNDHGGYAESGKKYSISFEASEDDDVGMLRNIDQIKTSVTSTCGDLVLNNTRVSSKKKNGYIKYEYEFAVPQNASGACKTLIVAEDAYGNKRESEWAFAVDFIPPEITSPSNGDEVSGTVAIYGHAEDPFLPSGQGFQMYELSYKSLDKENDVWKSIGMFVPESQRCANFAYRSCKPVLRYSANSVLGYWNTNMIPEDERNHAYRIRVVTFDTEYSKEAYVDVTIAEQNDPPVITFDNLPSEMNFETTNSYNIDWKIDWKKHVTMGQNAGLVRLEIMRLNENGEKTVSVVNRNFENVVPDAYYGTPQDPLGMGAYLWIEKNDNVQGKNRYHLKLVAGDKKTAFTVPFYTGSSASLNILSSGSNSSSDDVVNQNLGGILGTTGTISKTLQAKKFAEYIIETDSKQGLFWNLASSTLEYEGGEFEGLVMIPFYVKNHSSEEFAFIGSNKMAIGSKLQNEIVHIPSNLGGRNFVWDGLIDQTSAKVPSGNYRFKVTLEGLEDYQAALDEKIVKIVGKSVSLTNVKAVPDKIKFSSVTPQISFHFNIDQDAKVRAYVRSKNGSAPTDLNEVMKLGLDGQELLLDKLLLAGRQVDYVVNWDGSYGKSSQITPNKDGYEFVVEVYDLDGNLKKTSSANFSIVAEDMEEDNEITISIDGNSTRKIEHGGQDYLIASGMNDAVLEFAPAGTRIVTDVVPVQFGYKGRQSIRSYPYERYSVGVQIHKKSISYWAVVAVKYVYMHEDEGDCDEKTQIGKHVAFTTVTFNEDDGLKTMRIGGDVFNFSNSRGSDMGGWRMGKSNVHLLLIPQTNMDLATLYGYITRVSENDYSNAQTEWNKLVKKSTADFKWFDKSVFDDDLKDNFSLKSSGRVAKDTWVTKNNRSYPYSNSTIVAWDRTCDVGKKANASVCATEDVHDRSDDPTRANGVYDEGEPILYKGESYDPSRHEPEIEVVAWAWKNTDGKNKEYSSDDWFSCLGGDNFRHNLMFIFDITPQKRFWANPTSSNALADYGWNNDVNRYLTLDPMNENFLFGANGAFKDEIKAPYANPYSNPIVYDISNRQEDSWTEQTLMNLLNNKTFQQYYRMGFTNVFDGQLASDVVMILHNFKIDPSSRKYYPAQFNIDVTKGSAKETIAFDDNSINSRPISLGGLQSGSPLTISVGMNKNSVLKPGFDKKALDWPSTQSNVAYENGLSCQPKKGVCGASPDDVLFDMSGVRIEKDADVHDGFKVYEIPITMELMPDGSSGFDLNSYLKQFTSTSLTGESEINYYSMQGPKDNYNLLEGYSKEDDITLTRAKIFALDPNGDYYVEEGTNILRKKGCEDGCVYVAADDPLMSKIDDDGDGRIAEDAKDNIDKDGDLAIDEDPSDAVRVKLENLTFPFTGGKDQRSFKDYVLYKLLSEKADNQNIVPGNSVKSGWSVLLKDNNGSWLNNGNLLTTWDVSNDPKSFERTGLFYKDGKKHTDIEIISARGMDNASDAKAASVRITPAKFDGRDRRLLEVKANMNWKTNDKYEIYASSDKGWIDLTPSPLGKLTNKKLGTIAYWDVETSGFHQLLLIRNAGGKKYYKVFPVAVGAITSDDNKVFADALGRSQISTALKVDFVDVVPLGKGEIPQTIPADAGLGPVVQIYPALTELKSAEFSLRFSKDEVRDQRWENDASIYVVSEGYSPQPLQGIQWHFYRIGNDGDEEVVGAKLTSENWDYAIATGILSITENANSEKTVQATLGEEVIMDSDGSSVSVMEKEAGVYEVDFNVTSAIGE